MFIVFSSGSSVASLEPCSMSAANLGPTGLKVNVDHDRSGENQAEEEGFPREPCRGERCAPLYGDDAEAKIE